MTTNKDIGHITILMLNVTSSGIFPDKLADTTLTSDTNREDVILVHRSDLDAK